MLTKEILLAPPHDLELLNQLESTLEQAAKRLIEEVCQDTCQADSLDFQISLGSESAGSKRISDGTYIVVFGRKLTASIMNMAAYLQKDLESHLKWREEPISLIKFIFDYISWIILNHEIAHIGMGHLDYVDKHQIVDDSSSKAPNTRRIIKLHQDERISESYWHALESEADAYTVSASLPSFFYINTSIQWKTWPLAKVLECHGLMISLSFHMMQELVGKDDYRHPDPVIRQYLTLPSIISLARKLGYEEQMFTDLLVKGHVETVSKILNKELELLGSIKSYVWMNQLDGILREMAISDYRRP